MATIRKSYEQRFKNIEQGTYWTPYEALSYDRNFMIIDSTRSVGKTYGVCKYNLDQALYHNKKFIFLVRYKAQIEKKHVFKKSKYNIVIAEKFPDVDIEITDDEMIVHDHDGGKRKKRVIGYCHALNSADDDKQFGLETGINALHFDEYIINNKTKYVNGWNEPSLLFSLYDTIDRRRDKLKVFMLANTITHYNPYHKNPAFNIPDNLNEGDIWCSDNVYYEWARKSAALVERDEKSKFVQMIKNTDYARYAVAAEYVTDSPTFIQPRPANTFVLYNIDIDGEMIGVWRCRSDNFVYIDRKYDPFRQTLAIKTDDHNEQTILAQRNNALLDWLRRKYREGNIRFADMPSKMIATNVLEYIL